MAASSSPNNSSTPPTIHSFANALDPDTTFVLADPDAFRDVVQRLTGPSAAGDNGRCRPVFHLRERKSTARKMEMKLHHDTAVASPVSPLEYPAAPTPTEEEEMAIAAKRFYLHRSRLSTPAGSHRPPELLPLFPLHSPTQSYESSSF